VPDWIMLMYYEVFITDFYCGISDAFEPVFCPGTGTGTTG